MTVIRSQGISQRLCLVNNGRTEPGTLTQLAKSPFLQKQSMVDLCLLVQSVSYCFLHLLESTTPRGEEFTCVLNSDREN